MVQNVGAPFLQEDRGTTYSTAPAPGVDDLSSPCLLSLHNHAYETTNPTMRRAIYGLVDQSTFKASRRRGSGWYDVSFVFQEVG